MKEKMWKLHQALIRQEEGQDLIEYALVVALIAFGEGLQNNHHAFPNSANHRIHWWEPDFAADVIFLLNKAGLIWNVKKPSPALVAKARGQEGIVEL